LKYHEKMLGKEINVLVTGPNPKKTGEVLGRSESYKVVNFKSAKKKGTFLKVKITGFGPYSLSGVELPEPD